MSATKLPTRAEVAPGDTWDLTRLYPADADWERAFQQWEARVPEAITFKGTLHLGPHAVRAYLDFDRELEREGTNSAPMRSCARPRTWPRGSTRR